MRLFLLILILGLKVKAQEKKVIVSLIDSAFYSCPNPFEMISKNDTVIFQIEKEKMTIISKCLLKTVVANLSIEYFEQDSINMTYTVKLDKGDYRRKLSLNHCYGFEYKLCFDRNGAVLVYCLCYNEKRNMFSAMLVSENAPK